MALKKSKIRKSKKPRVNKRITRRRMRGGVESIPTYTDEEDQKQAEKLRNMGRFTEQKIYNMIVSFDPKTDEKTNTYYKPEIVEWSNGIPQWYTDLCKKLYQTE